MSFPFSNGIFLNAKKKNWSLLTLFFSPAQSSHDSQSFNQLYLVPEEHGLCSLVSSHSEEAEIGVGMRRVWKVLKPLSGPASSSPLPHREKPAHIILGWSLGLSVWVAKQGDNILLTFLLFLKNIVFIYLLF